MHIYRKILIMGVILITVYLLYRFLQKKAEIQTYFEKEGIDFTLSAKPNLTNSKNIKLPLLEYHIKASMNSAYNGSAITIDSLKNVISRGCRFLDLEIFSVENVPVVAYSSTAGKGSFESSNTLPLNDVLKYISTNAFSNTAPNPNDPLFLFLNLKTANAEIFPLIKDSVNMNMNGMFYNKLVNKDTKLSTITKKVVIMIDHMYYLSLIKTPKVLSSFQNTILPYVNVYFGTTDFPSTTYSSLLNSQSVPPRINKDGATTNITKWQISVPDGMNPNNPILDPFIKEHGVQIVPYRFYLNDEGLSNYEDFFIQNGSVACVSMTTALLHMKNISE